MTISVGSKSGKLSFPNQSRSFDAIKNRVQFWGYDTTIEISFFVEADAIQKLSPPNLPMSEVEAEVLKIFDAAQEQIYMIANKVYSRGRKGCYAYSLVADDF